MKSGVDVQSDKFRVYKKKEDSEFDHPYKNPYTIKQYKKLGENFIAIAYEHKSNSIFNVLEKVLKMQVINCGYVVFSYIE